ncbi:MAG: DJ-1/PfpI family protein [Oceanipulchritudo sp.]
MSSKTALVIINDGVEELEALTPVDLLRRAGVAVTVASASGSLNVTGRNGIHLRADARFAAEMELPDLLVIPGGPGHADLARDEDLLSFLRKQNDAGKLIGSICAGPVVLKKAGVLAGRRFTSFPATAEELPERLSNDPVVMDGTLITSMGAGTAYLFALALVEELCGPEKRSETAASTCFPDHPAG